MSEISENNRRIAKNSIFMSIRMVIVLLITLYSTRVVLEVLGVEDYGIYNVVCGFVSMFAFLNTSMSNGIQRFFNFELGRNGEEGAKKVYNTAVIIQLILGIVILIGAEGVGVWYINNKMVIPPERIFAANWIFQFSLLSFIFIIMQAPYTAAVIAHERMDFYAVVSVLDAFLKLGIVFLIPYFEGDDLIWYGILLAGVSVINFVLYFTYCKRKFTEIIFEKGFDRQLFKSMLGFSGWNVFGSFSGVMKEQGINLVINLFYGPAVNAARGIAAQINAGLQSFAVAVSTPVRPQVVKSYSVGNMSRTINLTYSISKISCIVLYMMALPILLEIDFVLKIWLGNNIPNHTNTFVLIIVMVSFVNNLNAAVSAVVHASGKMKNYQLQTSIASMTCIPLSYFCLKFGLSPEAALWTVFVTVIIAQIFALRVLKTIIEYKYMEYVKRVLVPLFFVVITTVYIPVFIANQLDEGWIRFLIVSITSAIIISVSTYYCALTKSEQELLLHFLRKK